MGRRKTASRRAERTHASMCLDRAVNDGGRRFAALFLMEGIAK